jgi:hypothetical protein
MHKVGISVEVDSLWNSFLIKGFDKNDFEFGIRFETLDKYRELDLMVAYKIHY